jgi:uncharacterized protein YndB with AHSA1/START domain
MRSVILAALVAALAGAARADVVETNSAGFRLKTVTQIAASPDKVYAALGEIGRWWSSAHSYSGDAANMTMPLQAGACFCEKVPGGGSVQHGVVATVMPQRGQVRVLAAFGPLQDEGVTAALTFQFKAANGGTELVTTYNVGGAREAVTRSAPGIDFVLTEAATRLKRYLETGKP